jgi:hypothetical protein
MNDQQLQKSSNKLQLTRPVDVLPSLLGKEVAPAGDRYEDWKIMSTMHLQQQNQVREIEQQNLSCRKNCTCVVVDAAFDAEEKSLRDKRRIICFNLRCYSDNCLRLAFKGSEVQALVQNSRPRLQRPRHRPRSWPPEHNTTQKVLNSWLKSCSER